MSKAEILAELARLSPEDRVEILERLWRMEDAGGPAPREKALLDEAQADYDSRPDAAAPWSEVQARLR